MEILTSYWDSEECAFRCAYCGQFRGKYTDWDRTTGACIAEGKFTTSYFIWTHRRLEHPTPEEKVIDERNRANEEREKEYWRRFAQRPNLTAEQQNLLAQADALGSVHGNF